MTSSRCDAEGFRRRRVVLQTDPITAAVAKRMEAGQDLAKQLLAMLGTLLAAIDGGRV